MSERTVKQLKRKYPHLIEEIGGDGTIIINSVRSSPEDAEKVAAGFRGGPTVIDFIRRCETDDQAIEIINFLERKGEIDGEHAKRLRVQLAEHGLRSFGKKREPGCYESGETG